MSDSERARRGLQRVARWQTRWGARAAMILIAMAGLSSCDDDPKGTSLVVESDTRWRGTIIGSGVSREDRSGDYHLRIGNGTVCWELTKMTHAGYLRTYVVSGQSITGPNRRAETTVTDSGATVHGCNR